MAAHHPPPFKAVQNAHTRTHTSIVPRELGGGERDNLPDHVSKPEPVGANVKDNTSGGERHAHDVEQQVGNWQIALLLDHALEHAIHRRGRRHKPIIALRCEVMLVDYVGQVRQLVLRLCLVLAHGTNLLALPHTRSLEAPVSSNTEHGALSCV
jgi:hypothetical protein